MHLSEDLLIVEPVDEAGRPVATGERSAKLYLTNLFNRDLPLIRYEITDEVTIETEPCLCGSAHRCVADVQGRLDDVFLYNGRRVHPHVFRSVLGGHAGVVEYQVRQTVGGAEIALRCSARVDLDRVRVETADALAGAGVARPVIGVTAVDQLERDPGPAKLRRFVPLDSDSRHRRRPVRRNGRRGAARPVTPAAL
jgi:phenylacetate-coenzyme A ligase PaaK-like adenylate-forming protein